MGSEWRRLTPTPAHAGHLKVTVARRTLLVHRLVLLAFVGPCPAGMESRHFPDRDPTNNALSNLRWDTPTANQRDRVGHGTDSRGERHGRAKLTARRVLAMRADRAAGMTYLELSRKYRVPKSTVCHIITRRIWAHI